MLWKSTLPSQAMREIELSLSLPAIVICIAAFSYRQSNYLSPSARGSLGEAFQAGRVRTPELVWTLRCSPRTSYLIQAGTLNVRCKTTLMMPMRCSWPPCFTVRSEARHPSPTTHHPPPVQKSGNLVLQPGKAAATATGC